MRYRKQRRGGKGVRDIRTNDRNGPVVGVAPVRDGDDIVLITTQGMVNRTHVSEIRVVGRNTQGVRIMDLKEGDRIASIAKVAREEAEQEGDDQGSGVSGQEEAGVQEPPPEEPGPEA
jgi:DNA gyrase subunit A